MTWPLDTAVLNGSSPDCLWNSFSGWSSSSFGGLESRGKDLRAACFMFWTSSDAGTVPSFPFCFTFPVFLLFLLLRPVSMPLCPLQVPGVQSWLFQGVPRPISSCLPIKFSALCCSQVRVIPCSRQHKQIFNVMSRNLSVLKPRFVSSRSSHKQRRSFLGLVRSAWELLPPS